ncbi:hypothetical protein HG536_0B06110 [Torulaspora globosa]|uniref:Type 1 phosphatases regulator n=1 Tax=Torulaspora globosa TaxID=48254 RepID=A0A7G3ZE09_9SACH|nr:uncharacterized protein HG536_0B06110 [Torulaspora globosa]QLL31745.1 hypothetical protein HG536_0B06110 [Torulaspora globosa]
MVSACSNRNQQLEGSQTITVEEVRPLLQLRGEERSNTQTGSSAPETHQRPSVRWESGVIDNEHMNKKKTKICCIFHPQQEFDDDEPDSDCHSSSSSSSSSSSESESEKDLDPAERRQRRVERRHRTLKQNRPKSPNAYEIQPDYTHDRSKCKH